jgi:hypothetical protein
MLETVDDDVLLFGQVHAIRCQSARCAADALLAAAADPSRLDGVTPTLTRIRAADILSELGTGAEQAGAVAILDQAISLALPAETGQAQLAMAKTLAELGQGAELEAFAAPLVSGAGTSVEAARLLLGLAPAVTMFGYRDLASQWIEAARADHPAAGRGQRPERQIGQMLDQAATLVQRIAERAAAENADASDPLSMRDRWRRLRPDPETVTTRPPWPAVTGGALLWWPEPDYGRLVRQLPELADLLGQPWRRHTGRVQAALTARALSAPGETLTLTAAETGQFVTFIERVRADPLAPATMTAFAGRMAGHRPPAAWPPQGRAACWCGSGRRYRDCCRPAR